MSISGISGSNSTDSSLHVLTALEQALKQAASSGPAAAGAPPTSSDSSAGVDAFAQSFVADISQGWPRTTDGSGDKDAGNTYGPPPGFVSRRSFRSPNLAQVLAQTLEDAVSQSSTNAGTGTAPTTAATASSIRADRTASGQHSLPEPGQSRAGSTTAQNNEVNGPQLLRALSHALESVANAVDALAPTESASGASSLGSSPAAGPGRGA